MVKKISTKSITNINKNEFRTRMMHDVVAHVKNHGRLHIPLLTLVTCFIDGLAKGKSGNTKKSYLKYVKKYFPDLCKELGAEIFYSKFRCAAVHEFSIKKGYGIDRDSSMKGKYTDTLETKKYKHQIVVLNIDRLVDDFLLHINKLRTRYNKKTP